MLYLAISLGMLLAAVAWLLTNVWATFELARSGRVAALVGVVVLGLVACGIAGRMTPMGFREGTSWVYVLHFAGVWLGFRRALKYDRSAVRTDDQSLPGPVRDLPRSSLPGWSLVWRNVAAFAAIAVPLWMLLWRLDEYAELAASANLQSSSFWRFGAMFALMYVAALPQLFGVVLYEVLQLKLPPKATRAANDRRALALLPLIMAPWIGQIAAVRSESVSSVLQPGVVALVQSIVVYFFLLRRAPTSYATAGIASPAGVPSAAERATRARARRYAAFGAIIGAAVAAFALATSGVTESGPLGVAAEQMFILGLPVSIPVRALLLSGGYLLSESPLRLLLFVVATPTANGAFLGWVIARLIGSRRDTRPIAAPD